MLTLTAGEFRGRRLEVANRPGVRPMMNRVRESVFNILDNWIDWQEVVVWDLYAGAGSIGFEALSRGAKACTFVDNDRQVIQTLKRNQHTLKLPPARVQVIQLPVDRFLKKQSLETFNTPLLLACDPPYQQSPFPNLFKIWNECLPEGTTLVLESPDALDDWIPEQWNVLRHKVYGKTHVTLLESKT